MLEEGKTSQVSLIRVIIAGVVISYVEGTPQGEIVEAILASAFEDWADHVRIMEANREEAAKRLLAL